LKDIDDVLSDLTLPEELVSASAVLARPSCVPAARGLYGWYFRGLEDLVLSSACQRIDSHVLLYAGISPKREGSSQTLRHRIRYHYRGNAEGSTLRLTLGCLLADRLDIELRRVGSGKRMTFTEGETVLSAWMAENAKVVWSEHPEPWQVEPSLIARLNLPLNLEHNSAHPFKAELAALRASAKLRARALPVLPN
jgi:hypothetical protein